GRSSRLRRRDARTPDRRHGGGPVADRLEVKNAVKKQPVAITIAKTSEIEVIGHQRKARPAHLKALTASMERLGFLSALVGVETGGPEQVSDGHPRFQGRND